MPLPTTYSTGTASVANGATTLTIVGAVSDAIYAGDFFMDPAQPLVPQQRIASVTGGGVYELAVGWPGTTMTGASYEVRITPDSVRVQERTRQVLDMLQARAEAWKGPWTAATYYDVTDEVGQDGSAYICVAGHTSGAFATDLAAGKWQLLAAAGTDGVDGVDGTNGTNGTDGKFSATEVIKTAAYTALAADVGKTIILNKATADTLSFDAAATLGSTWMVMVKNIGAGTWVLDPSGAETINGVATVSLLSGQSVVVSCNGTMLRTFFAGGIGGSTATTDNALLRADGTGGATIQASPVIIDDSGNVSGVGSMNAGANISTGEAIRTFNLIDPSAAVRVWRWMALGLASPTVELIQGMGATAADTANTWWDMFTEAVGGVASADRFHIRRRTGGALSQLFTVDGTGALIMGGGSNIVFTASRHPQLRSYTVSTLPSASPAGQMIYVSNETGGATPAFSDGTNWRRVADRTICA